MSGKPAPPETAAGHAPLLAARGIHVSFPVGSQVMARMRHTERLLRAVDGVDLEIGRGEALALVGESGSGKSTLALALSGLRPADSGQIQLNGRTVPARRSRADQRRVQMVFQDPYSSLNPRLTVGGMLRELLRVHHVVPASQVPDASRELLHLVGLGDEALRAYPRQFSGGQRQRVAIARALALRPELLIADEPMSALDVSVQQGYRPNALARALKQRRTGALAFVIPLLRNPIWVRLQRGALQRAGERGYLVMIMEEPGNEPKPPGDYRYLVEESRADGLLLATALRIPGHASGVPAVPHVYVNQRGPAGDVMVRQPMSLVARDSVAPPGR